MAKLKAPSTPEKVLVVARKHRGELSMRVGRWPKHGAGQPKPGGASTAATGAAVAEAVENAGKAAAERAAAMEAEAAQRRASSSAVAEAKSAMHALVAAPAADVERCETAQHVASATALHRELCTLEVA